MPSPPTSGARNSPSHLVARSGSQTIFRPQRKNDLSNYQVRFYQAKNGQPKVFAASLWPYFDAKRAFVFL